MELPKSINPCPIIDALVEIRFSTNAHPNAVFGLVYNELQQDFKKVENLNILQLPETLRANDPNLKYKPHYKISNNNYIVQIGPEVLSISSFPNYVGWNSFSKQIIEILNRVEKIGFINKVLRIGIRYINFFNNNDIFNNINLNISIGNEDIEYRNTVIRTEVEQESFKSSLQISNNAQLNNKFGSVIDIDTFTESNLENFFGIKDDFINKGHIKEKELFYSLLKEQFLETLNPQY